MIEVVVDRVQVSLMSQHRVVILKDLNTDRYLAIWIGSSEAEAITIELQEVPPPRPLTHDLLKATIDALDAKVEHVLISHLNSEVFYARLVVSANGKSVEIDSRSSDAIAIAVRAKAPIFVSEQVMEDAAFHPDKNIEEEIMNGTGLVDEGDTVIEKVDESKLSAFADFVNSLNLDDLDDEE